MSLDHNFGFRRITPHTAGWDTAEWGILTQERGRVTEVVDWVQGRIVTEGLNQRERIIFLDTAKSCLEGIRDFSACLKKNFAAIQDFLDLDDHQLIAHLSLEQQKLAGEPHKASLSIALHEASQRIPVDQRHTSQEWRSLQEAQALSSHIEFVMGNSRSLISVGLIRGLVFSRPEQHLQILFTTPNDPHSPQDILLPCLQKAAQDLYNNFVTHVPEIRRFSLRELKGVWRESDAASSQGATRS